MPTRKTPSRIASTACRTTLRRDSAAPARGWKRSWYRRPSRLSPGGASGIRRAAAPERSGLAPAVPRLPHPPGHPARLLHFARRQVSWLAGRRPSPPSQDRSQWPLTMDSPLTVAGAAAEWAPKSRTAFPFNPLREPSPGRMAAFAAPVNRPGSGSQPSSDVAAGEMQVRLRRQTLARDLVPGGRRKGAGVVAVEGGAGRGVRIVPDQGAEGEAMHHAPAPVARHPEGEGVDVGPPCRVHPRPRPFRIRR